MTVPTPEPGPPVDPTAQLHALLAQAPGAAGPAQTPSYLGVPSDYTYVGSTFGGPGSATASPSDPTGRGQEPYTVPPRYQSGAEFAPSSLSPEDIARLQGAMAMAGLIGPKTRYRIGVWDDTSVTAYRKALSFANQSGQDVKGALAELANAPQVNGAGTIGAPHVNVVNLSDPQGIIDALQNTAKNEIGRELSTDEANRFVKLYQGLQRDAQTPQIPAVPQVPGQPAPTVNVETTTPDLSSQAGKFVKDAHGQEAANFGTAHVGRLMLQLMEGRQ